MNNWNDCSDPIKDIEEVFNSLKASNLVTDIYILPATMEALEDHPLLQKKLQNLSKRDVMKI